MRPPPMTKTDLLAHPPLLSPRGDALFLDLDGTLLEIAAHPTAVAASDTLNALLHRLTAAMDGACAVITGRTVADADAILEGAIASIAGVHGAEVKTPIASTVRWGGDDEPAWAARADAYALASRLQLLIEDKRASLAIHFRNTPQAAAEVRERAAAIAAAHGLRVLEGHMVVELVAGERTKGDALAAFMAHPPFVGRRPVAIGDDVTDEDAFKSAASLGGFGVRVGLPRETAAAYALDSPSSVEAWLEASLRGHA